MATLQDVAGPSLTHVQQIKTDPRQVKNKAGGFVFKVNDFDRLKRFLVLGSESGTYYASGEELGLENVKCVTELLRNGKGEQVIDIIKEFSIEGRCPKQTTLVYCLALCARFHEGKHGEGYMKIHQGAYGILPDVCRIPTDLFQFVQFCEDISKGINAKTGWGRAHRRAIGNWYLSKTGRKLAYLVTKYKQRNGWSHKDLLRLSHPKTQNDMNSHAVVFKYIIKGFQETKMYLENPQICPSVEDVRQTYDILKAVNDASSIGKATDITENEKEEKILKLIEDFDLVREQIPTPFLKSLKVWFNLLCKMPLTALIRNLGKMSSLGMFEDKENHQGTEIALKVSEWLKDEDRLQKARIHPFNVLVALKTYESGHGDKGSNSWVANKVIVEALNDAFYKSFKFVKPTNKRYLLGIDMSGSMSVGGCHGCTVIKPSEASAAMAMVALKTEPKALTMAFSNKLVPLGIKSSMTLEAVLKETRKVMFGSTDCAQPMLYAKDNGIHVDIFVIYTDNDTWCGEIHPFNALEEYREAMDIPDAKLIVCAMASNGFTIANPDDPGMLDIVGFDSAAPQIIAQFAEQTLNQ